MSAYADLLRPLDLGPITLKNRASMAPLTRNRCWPGTLTNDSMVEYYRQRVAGGASLIVTEAILVSQQGSEWPNAPGLWSKEHIPGWKKIVDAVHNEGGYIYAQLWHTGRVSHPDMPEQKASGLPVYAPSAIAAKGGKFRQLPGVPGYVQPTEIDDPNKLVEQFRVAALNAKDAGFDGIEFHGASGYLIAQFLDSTSNKRTDQWGGSVENRARFPLELLRTAVDIWGPGRVAIKLSPCGGYNDVGMPLQETLDTFSYFIRESNKYSLSYVCFFRYTVMFDPAKRGTEHDVIEAYAKLVQKPTKVYANCGYTPEEATKAIAEGKVDAVSFGLLWLMHPDLVKRIEHGKPPDNALDMATLYSNDGTKEGIEKGYTDYPTADYGN